jgi:hypothetical protein
MVGAGTSAVDKHGVPANNPGLAASPFCGGAVDYNQEA